MEEVLLLVYGGMIALMLFIVVDIFVTTRKRSAKVVASIDSGSNRDVVMRWRDDRRYAAIYVNERLAIWTKETMLDKEHPVILNIDGNNVNLNRTTAKYLAEALKEVSR